MTTVSTSGDDASDSADTIAEAKAVTTNSTTGQAGQGIAAGSAGGGCCQALAA